MINCGIFPFILQILRAFFQEKCGEIEGFTMYENTHVIVGSGRLTREIVNDMEPELLEEMLQLKHFVTFEWMTMSMMVGSKADEEQFLLFPYPT